MPLPKDAILVNFDSLFSRDPIEVICSEDHTCRKHRATPTAMWFQPRSTDHAGTPPAAAMPTPFNFPCGKDFLNHQEDKQRREKCAPPNFDEYWWSSAGYYSPALCPRGYSAGCFRWHSDQGPAVAPTETAVQCVPKGYACATDDISNAVSDSETAPMIQIRWAQTDLPYLATHPLYPGVEPTNYAVLGEDAAPTTVDENLAARQVSFGPDASFTRVLTETGSSTRGGSGGDDNNGRVNFPTYTSQAETPGAGELSVAAKAGMSIAASAMGLLIAGIIWFFLRKHRRDKLKQAIRNRFSPKENSSTIAGAQPQMTSQGPKYELPAGDGTSVAMPAPAVTSDSQPELDSKIGYRGSTNFPAELHNQGLGQHQPHQQRSELSAISPRSPHHHYSELSGTSPQYNRPDEMDKDQHTVQIPSPTYQTPSPGLQAPTAPPPASTPPAAAVQTQTQPGPSADELLQQQARLEERRQRLLELERIEREQEELQQRINAQGRS